MRYSKNSLPILNNKTKLRFALVWIITSKWFDRLIMLLIIINSILLGIKDYTVGDNDDAVPRNKIIK